MTELLREYWDWFLLDTLVWTGALIALVLLIRRPVARHLGAGAAYSLWALPAFRLVMPPLTLPQWMAPSLAEPVQAQDPAAATAAAMDFAQFAPIEMAGAAPVLAEPTDFTTPLAIVWLVGAMIFLARRFWLYGRLRSELLDDAVPVGEVGSIRLVETPAISGPLAFGVRDKVIALPSGFMTGRDRVARDLAIAHELAHHRGHDLLANILLQPLFAAHWFNPLGYMGWTALRRDQEAACDARVVAARPREERAVYAGVIADYARRPQAARRLALAAPMACPVLGDKSIIHRLRNLSMDDVTPRRRMVARSGIAAALLALPMTASICYSSALASPLDARLAAAEVPPPPQAPLPPEAPEPPLPPEAPLAPPAPNAAEIWFDEQRDELREERREERAERQLERQERRIERAEQLREARVEARRDWEEGRKEWARGRIAYAEGRKQWAEGRVQWAEGRKQWAEGRVQHAVARSDHAKAEAQAYGWSEANQREIEKTVELALRHVPKVVESCRYPDQPVTSLEASDGSVVMYVCETAGDRIALKALKSARAGIAASTNLSDETRREILRELDSEIAQLSR
ncbi:M56 family metallopeptidase [Qipengyuania sp. XHP0207]|uniref:M56 family metallopeptidase n=1 Tax=Qipengyuania sp. XHP0207 TaxID=3038078 RepID=UPI0024203E73|nr:M56 family metallopeptidase [Qipengyuania sp. XHP0207]MDG5747401.1 M56 family metallopeptidase [Qipengyuania sp. XHP0207]